MTTHPRSCRRPLLRSPLATLALIAAALGVSLGACTEPPPQPWPENVVARYQGGEITRAELDDFVLSLPPKQRQPTEDEDLAPWRHEKIERLAARRLMIEQAKADGDGDAALQRRLEEQRQSVLARAVSAGISAQVQGPSEDETRSYYDDHRGRFQRQELLNLRHIYLRYDDQDEATERQRKVELMKQLRQRAQAGEDFAALAREHSDSANAEAGGSMNMLARGHTFPAFEEAAFALDTGEVSDVFTSPRGVHLVRLETRLDAIEKSFDESRQSLSGALRQKRIDEALSEAQEEYSEEMSIEIHPGLLRGDATPESSATLIEVDEYRLDVGTFASLVPAWRQIASHSPERLETMLADRLRQMIFARQAEISGLEALPAVAQQIEATRRTALLGHAQSKALAAHAEQLDDAIVRQFFDDHPDLFQTPRKIEASRIFLRCEPDRVYPTFLRAEELVRQLRAGEDFAAIARKHSDGPLAAAGGRMPAMATKGLASQGKEVFNAVSKLAPGEISEPVLVPHNILAHGAAGQLIGGLLIVKVESIEPARPLEFSGSEARARELYMRKYQRRILAQIEQQLLEEAELEVHTDALGSV